MAHNTHNILATLLFASTMVSTACTPDADGDGYDAVEDCDDTNASVHPGAAEFCDEIDNNCDGRIDEPSEDADAYYADKDRDGFGDASTPIYGCIPPYGAVSNDTDCDDTDPLTSPDAEEICDLKDNDCDTEVDESDAVNAPSWWPDTDGDGFGVDTGGSVSACAQPDGYAAVAGDCDDSNPDTAPGFDERCDNQDNDCDTEIDESPVDGSTFFADTDKDGFGNSEVSEQRCASSDGWVDNDLDCDDSNENISPNGTEVCDGLDNDCDPTTPEAGMVYNTAKGNAASIQSALLDAAAGDTINICEGTYTESLFIKRSVRLHGPNGAKNTILRASGNTSVVRTSPSVGGISLEISGLTITGGNSINGGGIDAESAQTLTVDNSIISGNTSELGGGIAGPQLPGITRLNGTTVRDNTADIGGGLLIAGGEILNSNIENNTATDVAGGLYAEGGTSIDMTGSLIASNLAEVGGGAVFDTVATVSGGEFKANIATFIAGGLYAMDVATLQDMTVNKNTAGSYAGGAVMNGSSTINRLIVSENSANLLGGGIIFDSLPNAVATDIDIFDNSAERGSAIYMEGGTVTLDSCTIESNADSSSDGGAVLITESSTLTSDNSNWGTGATDNSPADINFYDSDASTAYSYGTGASFTCDGEDESCN